MARKIYKMDFEIFESNCPYFKAGEKFSSLEDIGKRCPWLYDSANAMTRVLQCDGKLPWDYKGTKYEKIINKDGVTTEFVRCPDPTSQTLVLKIIRTELTEEQLKQLMQQKQKEKT
ncbi:MAG: hypothetical protein FK732_02275 [Asgard group archaeon]|nr:hypothetical protein [Asgard group archaeon]